MRCASCNTEQVATRYCGRCGFNLGERATVQSSRTERARPGVATEITPSAADGSRRLGWGVLVWLVLVAGVLALAAWQGADRTTSRADRVELREPDGAQVPAAPDEVEIVTPGPVGFADATETGLVIAGAAGRAVVVDLDAGAHRTIDLPGFAPDQPFDLWWLDGSLVSGARRIHTIDLKEASAGRVVAEARHFLPDVDGRQLWLVDESDGTTRSVGSSWAQIDAEGTLLSPWRDGGQRQLEPVRGVPGGLALTDAAGVVFRYDPQRDEIEDYLSDTAVWLVDANEHHVVWCERSPDILPRLPADAGMAYGCESLEISDSDGVVRTTLKRTDRVARYDRAWLSTGSSSHVAVQAQPGGSRALVVGIHDVESGGNLGELRVDDRIPHSVWGTWTPDGQFFLLLHERVSRSTDLVRWTPHRGFERRDVSWIAHLMPWGSGQILAFDADLTDGLSHGNP
jgi:hypothetical protein